MHKLSLYLTSFLLMVSAGSAKADVIKLTTNKAVGAELTLALNPGVQAQLVWGNGDTETFVADGQPQKITVKSESLEVQTGVEHSIKRFYAPANGLLTLDVTGAPFLRKLFCPNNEISVLDLSKNTVLTDLDVQGNVLTALDLRNCRNLVHLNCAQNQLESVSYTATNSPMEVFVCSENNLSGVGTVTSLHKLQALWVNKNKLKTLSTYYASDIETVNASSNELTTLTFGGLKSKLTNLWLENNQLKKLDFSKGTPALECVSLDHNQLTEVKWAEDNGDALKYVYCNDNQLYFNSFPKAGVSGGTVVLGPQRPFVLSGNLSINEDVDFSGFLTDNYGTKLSTTFSFYDANGGKLTKKKDTGDYYNTNAGVYTFYKPYAGVTAQVTSARFRGVTLTSQPFDVYDPTGIEEVVDDATGFSVSASRGVLSVMTSKACVLKIYDTMGRCVISENVSAGEYSYALASGIYVVNGQKYLVP